MADSKLHVRKIKYVFGNILPYSCPFLLQKTFNACNSDFAKCWKASSQNWQGIMNLKSKCFLIFPSFDLPVRFDSNRAFIPKLCSNSYFTYHL